MNCTIIQPNRNQDNPEKSLSVQSCWFQVHQHTERSTHNPSFRPSNKLFQTVSNYFKYIDTQKGQLTIHLFDRLTKPERVTCSVVLSAICHRLLSRNRWPIDQDACSSVGIYNWIITQKNRGFHFTKFPFFNLFLIFQTDNQTLAKLNKSCFTWYISKWSREWKVIIHSNLEQFTCYKGQFS